MIAPLPRTVVRLRLTITLPYQVGNPGGDFIFYLLAAPTDQQTVVTESLDLGGREPRIDIDPLTANRLLRVHADPGPFTLAYQATIDLHQVWHDPTRLAEVHARDLPPAVLPYLYPSRYCPSDRLQALANTEFGNLPQGYSRVLAIRDWVRRKVRFVMNTSTSYTGALETLTDGVGVCRDFAHLMIALCRAVNIPARFTTGIDYGADPALGPTDFHAYVEVFLGDRWWIFDPSGTAIPMGFVRLACGRDAADAAFATIFGPVQSFRPVLTIKTALSPEGLLVEPRHRDEALSTAIA